LYPRYARSFRTHIENVTVYAPEADRSTRSQISIAVPRKETVEFSYIGRALARWRLPIQNRYGSVKIRDYRSAQSRNPD